ncbi:hypothetical protein [Streptomyces sp. NPDC046821]|uniref:hypothetical protein n=1 Tax=Streptomyces sp. NPDC046821 TaxID=3154702 RepID=UPI0033C23522
MAAFGQPVFAGVYLSGEIDGLNWHAQGANLVYTLGLLQAAVGIAASRRMRRQWPTVVSVVILLAETGQYVAGSAGLLWMHLPLGVMLIASLTVLAVAVWIRPLPNRSPEKLAPHAQDAGEPRQDASHG